MVRVTRSRERQLMFFAVAAVVIILSALAVLLVRGYKIDLGSGKLRATGLLVATSVPNGAQVFIDGKLKSATDNTISLSPGSYNVEIKKEEFLTWQKNFTIEKELVTKTEATLFPKVPSLSALTFNGATNPVLSPDGTKLAFVVPGKTAEEIGLWVLSLSDLPLGFSRDPRQITGANLEGASVAWSPNSRQILLKNKAGVYFLLDAGQFAPQQNWVNVTGGFADLMKKWEKEKAKVREQQMKKLPEQMQYILAERADFVSWSPDETKVLYTATESASLEKELISPMPASSTQKQERDIKPGNTYVYDIKEDRNFRIAERPIYAKPGEKPFVGQAAIAWFPTSRHVVLVEEGKMVIADYDGTNYQTVYAGPFEDGYAFPYPNGSKLVILTNFNQQEEQVPNLYAISLK